MMKFQLITPEHEVLSSIPTTHQNPRLRTKVSNKHYLLREVHPSWWAGYSLCGARLYQRDFFQAESSNTNINSSNLLQSHSSVLESSLSASLTFKPHNNPLGLVKAVTIPFDR